MEKEINMSRELIKSNQLKPNGFIEFIVINRLNELLTQKQLNNELN